MLFRLIVLVLLCICCLAISMSCAKAPEGLTPCLKPTNPKADVDTDTDTHFFHNTLRDNTRNKHTGSDLGQTQQYYIDPQDGKYKIVPKDTSSLPADTDFLAVDDKGNLVQTDQDGIPSGTQSMADKEKADQELVRAKLKVKSDIVDGAAMNIVAANELLERQLDDNRQFTDVLNRAQQIQSNTEKIITDQQHRVTFQQGNMSDMIYELRLSTNEAEQAATILKQAAKTAKAKAAKFLGAGPAPGAGPSLAPSSKSSTAQGPSSSTAQGPSSSTAQGPSSSTAQGPSSGNLVKKVATDVNVCRSDEMYGLCSNEMLDASGKYVATVRDDGAFVVTTTADKTKFLFSTETNGKGTPPYRLFLLPDSNLALYDADNNAIWVSGTSSLTSMKPPFRTRLVDGSLSVVDASGNVAWNSSWVEERKRSCRSDRFGGLFDKEMFNASRKHVATVRDDGDFVVTTTADPTKYLFSTETKGMGKPPYRLYLLPDGNLVLYDASNAVLWTSETSNVADRKAPYQTKFNDNGMFEVVDAGDNGVWRSDWAEERKTICRSDRFGGLCNKDLYDSTRTYVATMRDDGDFVLTTTADRSKYLFSTNTKGKGKAPYRLYLQDNAYLFIFDADNKEIWRSEDPFLINPPGSIFPGTRALPPYKLRVEGDRINMYGGEVGTIEFHMGLKRNEKGNVKVWSTIKDYIPAPGSSGLVDWGRLFTNS